MTNTTYIHQGEHDENCFREENVKKFVQDYLDGKVPQHYLTEDLPEDWNKKPCKVIFKKNTMFFHFCIVLLCIQFFSVSDAVPDWQQL